MSERPSFNRYVDEPNLTGGSRPLDDSFKAPLPPAIRLSADPHSDTTTTTELVPYKSSVQSLAADGRPKVVNFEDPIDCSDAFGTRIGPAEHLPGTPMEPADLVSHHHHLESTTATAPAPAASTANAERRRSLSTIIANNHAEMSAKATAAAAASAASDANSYSIPMEPGNDDDVNDSSNNNNCLKHTGNSSTLQTKRSSLAQAAVAGAKSDLNRKNSKQDQEGLDPESLMFRDGRRKIDMVLCYEEEDEGVMTEQEARRREMRRVFLDNLVREGLELELEDKSQSFDEKTFFVKIHMPWKAETRYAEVMNLKLPIKRFITISVKAWVGGRRWFIVLVGNWHSSNLRFQDDNKHFKLPILQRWIRKAIKIIELDQFLSESESTFDSATAGGPPEEQ